MMTTTTVLSKEMVFFQKKQGVLSGVNCWQGWLSDVGLKICKFQQKHYQLEQKSTYAVQKVYSKWSKIVQTEFFFAVYNLCPTKKYNIFLDNLAPCPNIELFPET